MRTDMSDVAENFRRRFILLIGCYTLMWGVWLANPWWVAFNKSKAFDAMDTVMPEFAWGLTSILAGCLILSGWLWTSKILRVWGVGIGIIMWGTLAFMYFLADWQSTGLLTATFMCLLLIGTYEFEDKENRQ